MIIVRKGRLHTTGHNRAYLSTALSFTPKYRRYFRQKHGLAPCRVSKASRALYLLIAFLPGWPRNPPPTCPTRGDPAGLYNPVEYNNTRTSSHPACLNPSSIFTLRHLPQRSSILNRAPLQSSSPVFIYNFSFL